MIDYLTHYYRSDLGPFQSLSALPDDEALKIMTTLCDDTPFGERFKNPVQYLANRKATEQWGRQAFIAKGGKPQAAYPIPMVLGDSQWLDHAAPEQDKHRKLRIPLAIFTEYDVSFTYPDSMISHWFGKDKPAEFYLPELHGKVFTLPEILHLVEEKGLPEENWGTNLPKNLAPYIEAQVWRHNLLVDFRRR